MLVSSYGENHRLIQFSNVNYMRICSNVQTENNLPEISIVIPAYNEESRLPNYLVSIIDYFTKRNTSYEIFVVDDGSTDSTCAIVTEYSKQFPNVKLIQLPQNRGKGFAVKTGMLQASGALRLFADADGATPIIEFARLQKAINNGADVAIASRALHDKECSVKGTIHRKIMGSIFNFIVRTLVIRDIYDTQCGFKLFTAESVIKTFPLQNIDGFCFDVEIIFLCKNNGLRIKEIPVNWADKKVSKVKLFRDSYRMFFDVLNLYLHKYNKIKL
jgi:dolichyl-phosphate beta-glucosyltransferase